MKIQKYFPEFPLSQYIDFIIFYEEELSLYSYLTTIPDGCTQLVFELKNDERILIKDNNNDFQKVLKHGWIQGNDKSLVSFKTKANATSVCIRFKPGGFYCLTQIPLTEMKNEIVDGESIWGRTFLDLRERLLQKENYLEIFQSIENFFLSKIQINRETSIVNFVLKNHDLLISEVAAKTGYSQKHLISIFKKHTGFSPKYFNRIQRFNQVLRTLNTTKTVDWSSITYQHHYFDQSHFIKEFQHFTGLKPTHYLASSKLNPNNILHN
jgi:AraC-like DNA-binding protein